MFHQAYTRGEMRRVHRSHSFFFGGVPAGPSWNAGPRTQLGPSGTPLKKIGFILAFLLTGCVQRQMNIISDPPGAIVYMNDREIGRTPFQRNFQWYGTYDVVLRKDGYQTQKTFADVNPPFWQFVPLDAVTDFLPLKDVHTIKFTLKPEVPVDPTALMQRGLNMQDDLQSSEHTLHRAALEVHPTSRPTTQPAMPSDERGSD